MKQGIIFKDLFDFYVTYSKNYSTYSKTYWTFTQLAQKITCVEKI